MSVGNDQQPAAYSPVGTTQSKEQDVLDEMQEREIALLKHNVDGLKRHVKQLERWRGANQNICDAFILIDNLRSQLEDLRMHDNRKKQMLKDLGKQVALSEGRFKLLCRIYDIIKKASWRNDPEIFHYLLHEIGIKLDEGTKRELILRRV